MHRASLGGLASGLRMTGAMGCMHDGEASGGGRRGADGALGLLEVRAAATGDVAAVVMVAGLSLWLLRSFDRPARASGRRRCGSCSGWRGTAGSRVLLERHPGSPGDRTVLRAVAPQHHTMWFAPGILEAMKPGRMQGHGGTEEVPG